MPTTSKLVASLRKWMKRAAPKLLALHLAVEPAPASRPRVSKFGVYYGKTYQRFLKEAQPLADAFKGIPTNDPVFVLVEAVCTKPKTGKLEHPRGDVDNYVKGPLDVITKAASVWHDDNQIVGLAVFKRYAEQNEEAGVNVEWFALPG